jgi:uncharacterized protein DUF6111
MIRPVLAELAFFLAPFALYAAFLWFSKTSMLDREDWTPKILMTLTIVALLTVIISFVLLGHFTGAPIGSTYEPAHVENGKLIPGRVVP